MTQPKHTPGPWVAHSCYVSGQTDDISIAVCSHRGKVDYVEAEANARLIAAAPEMLEALELCVQALKDHCQYGDADDLENIAHDTAEQMLYKAKGE